MLKADFEPRRANACQGSVGEVDGGDAEPRGKAAVEPVAQSSLNAKHTCRTKRHSDGQANRHTRKKRSLNPYHCATPKLLPIDKTGWQGVLFTRKENIFGKRLDTDFLIRLGRGLASHRHDSLSWLYIGLKPEWR